MKKIFLFLSVASLLFTACLKDGFNDFDALHHPITIQGELNPTLGIPVGVGEANIYDMLHMLQLSNSELNVNSNGTIVFVYSDTTLSWHIDIDTTRPPQEPRPRTKAVAHVSQKVIQDSLDIDLFQNMSILEGAELEVDSILVYLQTYVKVNAKPGADSMLQAHNVHIYYDSIAVSILGQDNNVYHILSKMDSVSVEDVLNGHTQILLNKEDISVAVNKRMKRVNYCARLVIQFEDEFFSNYNMTADQYIYDTLGLNSIDIKAGFNVRFPLSTYINNLDYATDIDFTPSFHLGDLKIDSSMLFMECLNEIPYGFNVDAQFLDGNGNTLCQLFEPAQTLVESADVTLDPATGIYHSTTPKSTVMKVPVTASVFDALLNTSKIHLHFTISSTPTGDSQRKCVSIQADDMLKMRIYAKLKPSYTLELNIGGNEEGGEK